MSVTQDYKSNIVTDAGKGADHDHQVKLARRALAFKVAKERKQAFLDGGDLVRFHLTEENLSHIPSGCMYSLKQLFVIGRHGFSLEKNASVAA